MTTTRPYDHHAAAILHGNPDATLSATERRMVDAVAAAAAVDSRAGGYQQALADHELLEEIDNRDTAAGWADKLAEAIAPVEVIGEHSSTNNPWARALEALPAELDRRYRAGLERADDIAAEHEARHRRFGRLVCEHAIDTLRDSLAAELSAAPAPADTQPAEPWRPAPDYGCCVSGEEYEPGDEIRPVVGGVECRGCVEAWGPAGTASDETAPPARPESPPASQQPPAGSPGDANSATGDSGPARAVEEWNARYPIGTPVTVWPGVRQGPGCQHTTRSRAQVLSGHTAVVWVEGHAGCIALTHVEPTAPAADTEKGQR